MEIGSFNNGTREFSGSIDDVRIYDSALTENGLTSLVSGSPNEPEPRSLTAQFLLDENAGTTATDTISGQSHAITGATWTADPTGGSALEFDGSNDYLSVGTDDRYKVSGPFTLAARIGVDRFATWHQFAGWSYDSGSNESGYGLVLTGGGRIAFALSTTDQPTLEYMASSKTYSTGEWLDVAGVYNGATMTLYVNGEQVAQRAKTGTVDWTWTEPHGFQIGRFIDNNKEYRFDGAISKVELYDEALAPADMSADNQDAGNDVSSDDQDVPPTQLLAAQFLLDGNSGTTATDSVSSQSHAISGASRTADPSGGSALEFDGSNDYLSVGTDDRYKVTGPFTLAARIRVDRFATWHQFAGWSYDSGTNESGYGLFLTGDGRIAFALSTTDQPTLEYMASSRTYSTGQWLDVAGVYDGSTMTLYVNGEEVAQRAKTGAVDWTWTEHHGFQIGRFIDNNEEYRFDGAISKVELYSQALSPANVGTDFEGLDGVYKEWPQVVPLMG